MAQALFLSVSPLSVCYQETAGGGMCFHVFDVSGVG